MYVGVGVGSLVPFVLMDSIGRKGTLLFTTVPKIAAWIFIGLATSVPLLFVGRVLAGIGCGVTYAVMPMYLGEISSKRTRGPLGTNAVDCPGYNVVGVQRRITDFYRRADRAPSFRKRVSADVSMPPGVFIPRRRFIFAERR